MTTAAEREQIEQKAREVMARRQLHAVTGIEDDPGPTEPPVDDEHQDAAPVVSLLSGMTNAAAIDGMEFDPLVEHVPHLITEGFGILAGAPKTGKSWLALSVALACAHGGYALGSIKVTPRAVLLLALEDGHRRLQSRMRHLNANQSLPAGLDIITKVLPGLAAATIAEWLLLHKYDKNPPLVILDTLGKNRPQPAPGDNAYTADYQYGSSLKMLVDEIPGAALLAVHHTRKMADADWLATVSGTQGLTGSADYILILTRTRKSDDGILAVTGRDVMENEYAVKTDNGIWSLDGMDILDAAATVETRRVNAENAKALGDRSLDALKYVNSRTSTSPAELAEHLNIDGKLAGNVLGKLLNRGDIAKGSRGQYQPLATPSAGGESGESGESAGQPQIA